MTDPTGAPQNTWAAPPPAKAKKSVWKRWWFIAGAVVLALIVIGAITGSGDEKKDAKVSTPASSATAAVPTPTPPPVTAPPTTRPPANSANITKAEFDQIQTGMSHDAVSAIIGGPGELTSQSDLAGYQGEIWSYKGSSLGANAIMQFQNGALISKAQFGLN